MNRIVYIAAMQRHRLDGDRWEYHLERANGCSETGLLATGSQEELQAMVEASGARWKDGSHAPTSTTPGQGGHYWQSRWMGVPW